MGGSPTMNDILLRMEARIYKEPRTMSTIVKLTDRITGEDYVFEFKEMRQPRFEHTPFTLINAAIKRLREEWPADAR